jgi:hypothetical protein
MFIGFQGTDHYPLSRVLNAHQSNYACTAFPAVLDRVFSWRKFPNNFYNYTEQSLPPGETILTINNNLVFMLYTCGKQPI